MTQLTQEQITAVRAAEEMPLRLVDPNTNAEYVLIRSEVYERVRHVFDDPVSGMFLAQMGSAAAAGWDDPALDIYNELDPRHS